MMIFRGLASTETVRMWLNSWMTEAAADIGRKEEKEFREKNQIFEKTDILFI